MSIRVLLADPEEMLLDIYRDFLAQDGFEVETAPTGQDCLSKLRDWKPDALVLEPDMPNDWGEQILDEVNQHPQMRRVPTLILTRRDHKVVSYPVYEYHVKPVSMAELASSIRAAVHHRPASAE